MKGSYYDFRSCKETPLPNRYWEDPLSLAFAIKHFGVVILRAEEFSRQRWLELSKGFAKSFARPAVRRAPINPTETLTGKLTSSTDVWGEKPIGLHSEASFSPVWPTILSFFSPAGSPIPTDIADGVAIWNHFCLNWKRFFLQNKIIYELNLDLGPNAKFREGAPLPFLAQGLRSSAYRQVDAKMECVLERYAVSETASGDIAFCNHVFHTPSEPQIKRIALDNGDEFPLENFAGEIDKLYRRLCVPISWEENMAVFLDNRRIMHGRYTAITGTRSDLEVLQITRVREFTL